MFTVVHRTYPSRRRLVLVEDLVNLIIEQGQPWQTADLVRLMRVSPIWKHPVEQALYAKVTLVSSEQWGLISRTLVSRPDLRDRVKCLVFDDEPWIGSATATELAMETAASNMQILFSLLPRLSSLRVSGTGPFSRSSVLTAMEALPFPDTLEELEVIGPQVERYIPRMADKSLVWMESTPCRGLRKLSLQNVLLTFRLAPDVRGLPPNLTDLSLVNATIPNLISLRLFPPLKRLTVVTKASRHLDPFFQVRYIVPPVKDTLEEFSHTVDHEVQGAWEHYRWEMPVCPRLTVLETDADVYDRAWFPDSTTITSKLPNLKHWTIWNQPPPHTEPSINGDPDSDGE